MNILAQIIGCIAIMCWVFSIWHKDKHKILIYQLFANILYSIQYFVLNALTASFMNLTSTIRCLVFYNDEINNRKTTIYSFSFFCIIIALIGVLTYNGILSLIPIIITILYTYSVWQNNLKITRYIFIMAAFVWIYYNICMGAYVSVIGNILEIISGTVTLIKYERN